MRFSHRASRILQQFWDKLSRSAENVPLTEAQKLELDHRSDELDDDIRHGRPLGIPWDEVLKQVRS